MRIWLVAGRPAIAPFAATVTAAAVIAAGVLFSCGRPSPGSGSSDRPGATTTRTASALVDIARFEELQIRFAQDLARPRLLLLLSPT